MLVRRLRAEPLFHGMVKYMTISLTDPFMVATLPDDFGDMDG
jgi:hypothetical protein